MNQRAMFLTQADIHQPRPLESEQLRAYVFYHLLLADEVLVGDSQFNNNPALRRLIWPGEPGAPGVPCDLAHLIRNRFLLPVLRDDLGTLHHLRRDHLDRHVANVPDPGFVDYVEDCIREPLPTYHAEAVSTLFKQRVLTALLDPAYVGPGKLARRTAERVRQFVESQQPLLFAATRKWLRDMREGGALTDRECERVDRLVAASYLHNVPISLDASLDFPISADRQSPPFDIRLGTRQTPMPDWDENTVLDGVPAYVLSRRVLAKMPAEMIGFVKSLPSHSRVVTRLDRFRRGEALTGVEIAEDLDRYFNDVDLLLISEARGELKTVYREVRRHSRSRVTVKKVAEMGLSLVSVVNPIANVLTVLHAGCGALRAFRGAARVSSYQAGFISGRYAGEERLVLSRGTRESTTEENERSSANPPPARRG